MCVVCTKILRKLHDKGLISTGNIDMCFDELVKEAKASLSQVTEASPEFQDIYRQRVNEKGYDC